MTYHGLRRGLHTEFGGEGLIRTIYLTILWTHIPLAALIAFLVPRTFLFAIRGNFAAALTSASLAVHSKE